VPNPELTELHLDIMRVLWERDRATVADVHRALAGRGLAQATISTLLRRLEKKGVIAHDKVGREYAYRPLLSIDEAKRALVTEMTKRMLPDTVPALIHALWKRRKVSAAELAEVKALIEAKERELERGDKKRR
jgi:BlaI family transcriptional regulator, penicillinase repressor